MREPVTVNYFGTDVTVHFESWGISLEIEGYGTMLRTSGATVFVDMYTMRQAGGHPQVHIWSDIEEEDPTHSISLEKAKEEK